MEALERDGYVVISELLSVEECDEIWGKFWDFLEYTNPALRRDDRATWTTENLPLGVKGLIQHYNVGFQRFAVDARMKVRIIFEILYGTKELWSSFDGDSFVPDKGKRPPFRDLEHWEEVKWEKTAVHVDQTTPGFISVQGGLAVTDQKEDENVFVCVPGSHLHHEELLRIWEEEARQTYDTEMVEYLAGRLRKKPKLRKSTLHWQVMTVRQLAYLRSKGLNMIRVPMNKGDFVLWDSRTVHSSAGRCKTAREDMTRLQVFACMRPASKDERVISRETKKRRRAYDEGLVSKHSADEIRLFGKKPRTYSAKEDEKHARTRVPPSAPMSPLERMTHGLEEYPK